MSNLADLAPFLARGAALQIGTVAELREDGSVRVTFGSAEASQGVPAVDCNVLNPESSGAVLSTGDDVLVWPGDAALVPGERGVVLGRIGRHAGAACSSVLDPASFASRPVALVLEAQGEIVLRNAHARIRLGAEGDVEIACTSFATRSRRLLRLLAPLIKLN